MLSQFIKLRVILYNNKGKLLQPQKVISQIILETVRHILLQENLRELSPCQWRRSRWTRMMIISPPMLSLQIQLKSSVINTMSLSYAQILEPILTNNQELIYIRARYTTNLGGSNLKNLTNNFYFSTDIIVWATTNNATIGWTTTDV